MHHAASVFQVKQLQHLHGSQEKAILKTFRLKNSCRVWAPSLLQRPGQGGLSFPWSAALES